MPPNRPRARPRTPADDRRAAVWLVAGLLAAILLVVAALLVGGHIRRQALTIEHYRSTIEELSQRLHAIEQAAHRARLEAPASEPDVQPLAPSPTEPASAPATAPAPDEPAAAPQPDPLTVAEPRPVQTDADVRRALDRLLRPADESPLALVDRAAAETFLDEVRGSGDQVRWSGATLARLAALARLLGRDGAAEWFAVRAASAGTFPAEYHEIAVRQLLAAGRAAEASIAARRMLEGGATHPTTLSLLAAALALHGDAAGADEVLSRLTDAEIRDLHPHDRLRAAQALAAVEDWDRLETTLAALGAVAASAGPDVAFLRAVLAIQRGRPAEALGILDYLLARDADNYDLLTWRAVALLEARQFDAARAALVLAERNPQRAEAWYWRGVVELRAGAPDVAAPYLERAIVASPRFAPAWEALAAASLALADQATEAGADDVARSHLDAAVRALSVAIEANPRRGSTHFLLAVAHAKAGRVDQCAAAMQTAALLSSRWIEVARGTPIIARLFLPEELDALAAESRAPAPPSDPPPPTATEGE